MKIQQFVHGPQSTVGALAPGDLFFFNDVIHEKLKGVPDPDPNTALVVRLVDGQVTGIGKGDVVDTCPAVLEPES